MHSRSFLTCESYDASVLSSCAGAYIPEQASCYCNQQLRIWFGTFDEHFHISRTFDGPKAKRTQAKALHLCMTWFWGMAKKPQKCPSIETCQELVDRTKVYTEEQTIEMLGKVMFAGEKASASDAKTKKGGKGDGAKADAADKPDTVKGPAAAKAKPKAAAPAAAVAAAPAAKKAKTK